MNRRDRNYQMIWRRGAVLSNAHSRQRFKVVSASAYGHFPNKYDVRGGVDSLGWVLFIDDCSK